MSLSDDEKNRIQLEEVFRAEVQKDLADKSKPSDFLDSSIDFFRKHPALIGTLLYLQISTVGFVYNYVLFRDFGINVFEFAELNDFLLAAFKEPFALGMAFLTLLIMISPAVLSVSLRKRRQTAGRTPNTSFMKYQRIMVPVALVCAIVYTLYPPFFFGLENAHILRTENANLVTVMLNTRAPDEAKQFVAEPVTLIGTTEKYAFFYDKTSMSTIAIPVATIAALVRNTLTDAKNPEVLQGQESGKADVKPTNDGSKSDPNDTTSNSVEPTR